MTEIYMTIGIAGSGKSHHIKDMLGEEFYRLSRDIEGGRTLGLLPKLEAAIARDEKIVVLDCTFLNPANRAPFIELARKHNVPIHALFFNTKPEHAQFNMCWRMCERYDKVLRTKEDYAKAKQDPNMFPPMVHFKMVKELKERGVPSKDEGFPADEGFTSLTIIKSEVWDLPKEFTNKAIILDYDGTVRETKSGNHYPVVTDDIEVYPWVHDKLAAYVEDGYVLLGASNQSGVAKNNPPMEMAHACFQETNRLIGLDIDYDFDYSAAGPISSWHRKPLPGMGVDFIWKYKLDPSKTIYVGDLTTDKTFATRSRFQFQWAEDFFDLKKVKNGKTLA